MLDIDNVIAAFSEDQVERLTKLSKGRLRYWHKTGFFSPALVDDEARGPYKRFYSLKDVVALRTLEMLRVQNDVPLQELRRVAEKLSHLGSDLWTSTTLYVCQRKVVMISTESESGEEVISGQKVFKLALKKVVSGTVDDIETMRQRKGKELGSISRKRQICHNARVIAGTRIPVSAIQSLHEDGLTPSEIIAEYPDLTPEDVSAAIALRSAAA